MRKAFETQQRVIWVVEVGSVHSQAETREEVEQDYQSLDMWFKRLNASFEAKGRGHEIIIIYASKDIHLARACLDSPDWRGVPDFPGS